MPITTDILCYILGLASGILIMRYAYGLGVKSVQKIKDDLPLRAKDRPIEQGNTFD